MNRQLSHSEIDRIIDEQERELDLLIGRAAAPPPASAGAPAVRPSFFSRIAGSLRRLLSRFSPSHYPRSSSR